MIDERFIYLAVSFNFLGATNYLIGTLKGKMKPNKVTWFLWALAPLMAFAAEIQQKVGLSSLMTFVIGFNPLVIFLASFINKKSQWKLTTFDVICGMFSLLGLLFWSITRDANVAILFAILADGLAALPTLVKSLQAPETESSLVYLTAAISAFITVLTLKKWDFASLAFPLYAFLICIIFTILIRFKIGKRIKFNA